MKKFGFYNNIKTPKTKISAFLLFLIFFLVRWFFYFLKTWKSSIESILWIKFWYFGNWDPYSNALESSFGVILNSTRYASNRSSKIFLYSIKLIHSLKGNSIKPKSIIRLPPPHILAKKEKASHAPPWFSLLYYKLYLSY